jgi:hypothetical protein
MPAPEPVPVRDLEVADRIARAVQRGRAADREATLEQILTAFGEADPASRDARRRTARALALAGVATTPDLLEANPDERVALEVRGRRRRVAPLLGGLALLAVLGAAAALASVVVDDSDNTAATLPTTTVTTQAAPVPTTTTPATTEQPTSAERRAQRQERARRARAERVRRRKARARAAARRRVTVRLVASSPTFLCVDDGAGHELFNGTLSGTKAFRSRTVRLNIGLGPTTAVTANGKPVRLGGSPAGVTITPKGTTPLPLGSRPCA